MGSATWKQKKALNSTTSKTAPNGWDRLSEQLLSWEGEAEPFLRPELILQYVGDFSIA